MVPSKFMIVVVILIRLVDVKLALLLLQDFYTFLDGVFQGKTIGLGQAESEKPRYQSEDCRRKP